MTMTERRLQLHDILIGIMGTQGESESRVYFQPPASVKMEYPCIRYKDLGGETVYADDSPLISWRQFEILVIDDDPDSEIPHKVAKLPYCSPNRPYPSDNRNHWPFTLYY